MDLKITLEPEAFPPIRAHTWDAGLDLRAVQDMVISPGDRLLVHTGVTVAIPKEHVGLLIGRSGLGINQGVTLSNSVGVIDSEYRGEVGVGLVNHGASPVIIHRGDKIAQLLLVPVVIPDVKEVEQLDDTDRGAGGFGSTGR